MHNIKMDNEPEVAMHNTKQEENLPQSDAVDCEPTHNAIDDKKMAQQAEEQAEEKGTPETIDKNMLEETKLTEAVIQQTNGDTMEIEHSEVKESVSQINYNFTVHPKLLCKANKEYQCTEQYENFTKGCQWSPDGTCLLVPSEDFRIRLYELPRDLYSGKLPDDWTTKEFSPALTVKEGGVIYDSCWYPLMNSWLPETCCFLSASKESPVHLWDAFTGQLRATYRAYNQVDEVEASLSVQFVNSGQEVWCGFKNALRIFETERPGRQTESIEFKKHFPNMTGLVSCIRENPVMPGLIGFGTYSKCIGLYKDTPLCTFKVSSGVTQVEFSPCGTKLFSAVRRGQEFICWDLRNPGVQLYSLKGRQSNTNQRIQFTLSATGSQVASGGTNGEVTIWELPETVAYDEYLHHKYRFQLSKDCTNGVSLHKTLPVMATSSGQRLYGEEVEQRDNSVSLWWCS